MNLFTTLSQVLGNGCTATINVAHKDGTMTVSVLPGNSLVKDAAKNSLVPLSVSGTPQELDEGFVAIIVEPIRKAAGLLSDMEAFEKATEEAKAKSEMEKEKKNAEVKRKNDYNGYMALAKTNLNEQKYSDALKCVENAKKLAVGAEKDAVTKLTAEINQASGDGLFGPNVDKSDGKNVTLKTTTKVTAKNNNDNEEEEE